MRRPLLSLACLGLLTATAFTTSPALRRQFGFELQESAPRAAFGLVTARPYVLEESYVSYDRKEQPQVTSGWALTLRVPQELATLRNGLMPVLCVGSNTAERWNSGGPSGYIIVTVPSPLGPDGEPQLDLHDSPVWFAKAELPERVDAAWITQARQVADGNQLTPFDASTIEQARATGGETLRVKNHSELGEALSHWIETYSPEEMEYVKDLRPLIE